MASNILDQILENVSKGALLPLPESTPSAQPFEELHFQILSQIEQSLEKFSAECTKACSELPVLHQLSAADIEDLSSYWQEIACEEINSLSLDLLQDSAHRPAVMSAASAEAELNQQDSAISKPTSEVGPELESHPLPPNQDASTEALQKIMVQNPSGIPESSGVAEYSIQASPFLEDAEGLGSIEPEELSHLDALDDSTVEISLADSNLATDGSSELKEYSQAQASNAKEETKFVRKSEVQARNTADSAFEQLEQAMLRLQAEQEGEEQQELHDLLQQMIGQLNQVQEAPVARAGSEQENEILLQLQNLTKSVEEIQNQGSSELMSRMDELSRDLRKLSSGTVSHSVENAEVEQAPAPKIPIGDIESMIDAL